MKYMLLIHQGTTPLPGSKAWEKLSEDEQKAVYAAYGTINQHPNVTPGVQMQPPRRQRPCRCATARPLTTDGPFVETNYR